MLDHIEEEINAGTDFCSAKLNIEAIYNRFSETTKLLEKEVEKDLIKWSQKTTLLNRTNSSAQYSSLIMQTPVGQAKKILTNW